MVRGRWAKAIAIAIIAALVLGACGGDEDDEGASPAAVRKAARSGLAGLTKAQLAEAKRLLDPDDDPQEPTPAQIACVARVVVLEPTVDEIANNMAQIENGDLRELVMTDYLKCAYDFVLDLYMRFAPHGLAAEELTCVRSKFTELTVQRLSEVMILDPDAGYTGPLVIRACQSDPSSNPLLHGTLPGMGDGS